MGTAQLFDGEEVNMPNKEAVWGSQAPIAAGAAKVGTPLGPAV